MSLQEKLKKIRLLALDFDGTLTQGAYVIFREDGKESVICSRRDSLGLLLLQQYGITVIVLSRESSGIVSARCKKIGITCWHGLKDGKSKLDILQAYATQHHIQSEEVCYGGDDLNDIDPMQWVGVSFTVADGHELCKKSANYTTKANGGEGAVREVCEIILNAQGKPIAS